MGRRSQRSEEAEDALEFQQHWTSIKQQHHHRRSRSVADLYPSSSSPAPAPAFLHLLNTSPKKLISSLQQDGWRRRTVRGRRLLDDLECAVAKGDHVCSVCSSGLVQGISRGGIESSSSCCSCCSVSVGGEGCKPPYGVAGWSISPSSSSSSSFTVEEVKRSGGGWRYWMVSMGLLAMGVMCVVSLTEFGGEEYGERMVPTALIICALVVASAIK